MPVVSAASFWGERHAPARVVQPVDIPSPGVGKRWGEEQLFLVRHRIGVEQCQRRHCQGPDNKVPVSTPGRARFSLIACSARPTASLQPIFPHCFFTW